MEKELRMLKKMLCDAHSKIRDHRGKTWPRFGIEMFLLGAIVQSNACLNRLKKDERKIMESTIKLIKKQHDVLVQASHTIDQGFYRWLLKRGLRQMGFTKKELKSIKELRAALDNILNHSKDLQKESDMELTKIKLT